MRGLIDAIDDDGWRDWARRLPEPRHPEPLATETYLASLHAALEDRPGPIAPLSREARRSLGEIVAVHYDTITYLLRREALGDVAGGLTAAAVRAAGALGVVVPEAKAAATALRAVGALSARSRERRLKALEVQAANVSVLMLDLRRSLIAG